MFQEMLAMSNNGGGGGNPLLRQEYSVSGTKSDTDTGIKLADMSYIFIISTYNAGYMTSAKNENGSLVYEQRDSGQDITISTNTQGNVVFKNSMISSLNSTTLMVYIFSK